MQRPVALRLAVDEDVLRVAGHGDVRLVWVVVVDVDGATQQRASCLAAGLLLLRKLRRPAIFPCNLRAIAPRFSTGTGIGLRAARRDLALRALCRLLRRVDWLVVIHRRL